MGSGWCCLVEFTVFWSPDAGEVVSSGSSLVIMTVSVG